MNEFKNSYEVAKDTIIRIVEIAAKPTNSAHIREIRTVLEKAGFDFSKPITDSDVFDDIINNLVNEVFNEGFDFGYQDGLEARFK